MFEVKLKRNGILIESWKKELNYLIELKKEITGIYVRNKNELIVYLGYDGNFLTYNNVDWNTLHDFRYKIIKKFKKKNIKIYA